MKILSRPKGNAEEYGRWSVNPYIGCSHGCLYCYLKKGPSGAYLGQDKPVLKKGVVNEEHAIHLAMAEIIEHREEIVKDGGLFMTFTSDPCAKETGGLFVQIGNQAIRYGISVTLLTKRTEFLRLWVSALRDEVVKTSIGKPNDYEYIDDNFRNLAVGYTLTGHDELEPNAPTNAQRIDDMALISHYKGGSLFHIWASIEPVIDFPSSLNMILQALDAGCQHFKIGLLTNNTRVVRKDFSFGEYQFKAYDRDACVTFIHDVMRATKGNSTVYWKQSFRDFLGEEDFVRATIGYKNIVGKDWSMFNKED